MASAYNHLGIKPKAVELQQAYLDRLKANKADAEYIQEMEKKLALYRAA